MQFLGIKLKVLDIEALSEYCELPFKKTEYANIPLFPGILFEVEKVQFFSIFQKLISFEKSEL